MGSLKILCTTSYRSSIDTIALNCLVFEKIAFFCILASRWRISAIVDFRNPIMGSLKSPSTTSYRSPIETMGLNYLLFEKIAFCSLATDRQTDEQARCMKPLSLSRAAALKKPGVGDTSEPPPPFHHHPHLSDRAQHFVNAVGP